MRINHATLALAISMFYSHSALSEERYSFGSGVGIMYTGLGFSIARQTEESFGYLSIGCLGWNSDSEGNCGVSAGYSSNILFTNPRLSLGVYASATNDQVGGMLPSGAFKDSINEYRAGLSLNYHFNGLNQSGFIAGVTAYMFKSEFQSEPRVGLHLGYQW